MEKHLLLFLITLIYSSSFCQIEFKDGYLITNENDTVYCQIKDIGWKNNPTEVKFISKNGSEKIASIADIKVFGIGQQIKFRRFQVEIDRSAESLQHLDRNRLPSFQSETLFLKVLVEGIATLYYYEDGKSKKYFYDTSRVIFSSWFIKNI